MHLEFAFLVIGCLAGGWWQLHRALGGNGLSWFYTFEWPILAAVAIGGWWHLVHEDPEALWARKHPDWMDDGTESTAEGRVQEH